MFKTWTLIDILEKYDATKTDQYFIFKNSKYYIWKTNFKNTDNLKPIIAELNAHLTISIEAFLLKKAHKEIHTYMLYKKELQNL